MQQNRETLDIAKATIGTCMAPSHKESTETESASTGCATPEADLREGRRLEYLTIAWNVIEAVVSIAAGAAATSPSLPESNRAEPATAVSVKN